MEISFSSFEQRIGELSLLEMNLEPANSKIGKKASKTNYVYARGAMT